MCGLAGIVRFDEQPVPEARLRAMIAHMRHRGPDGENLWLTPRCALAYTRLPVIDVLSGEQPMHVPQTDSHGALHLIFNGEIYNHRALRRQLEKLGHRFSSDHSDTEVVLFGYRQWGLHLPKHLHGMFALAIWDAQERRLLLVRDRAGKKPLYVMRGLDGGRELMFASLAATIVAGLPASVRPQLNRPALLNYLRLGYTFEASMLDGIEEVPPAHWMAIDADGRVELQRYWRPPPISRTSTAMGAVEAVREVLTEAVNKRLESDVPLGCFLSGGIDSAVVAALAQARLREQKLSPLRTFSVAMPDIAYDEGDAAEAVARYIGATHTRLVVPPHRDLAGDLQRLIAVSGEPLADSDLLPTFWLSQETRRHVHVALSGAGGDELFGGHERYRAMHTLSRWRWALRSLPGAKLNHHARHAQPTQQYESLIRLFPEAQLARLNADEVHAAPDALWRDGVPDWPQEDDPRHAAMRWDLVHHLPFALLRKLDRASMAMALEVRCPFLDTQVCDLAGHLPASVLMPGNRSKALLRAFARHLLPEQAMRRSRRRWSLPLADWFRDRLRDTLADHLFDGTLERMGLHRRTMQQYFNEHVAQQVDHAARLFGLWNLSIWGRWLERVRAGETIVP